MHRLVASIVLLLLVSLTTSCVEAGRESCDINICLSPGASARSEFAATELQSYLSRIIADTGAAVEVKKTSHKGKLNIFVGDSAALAGPLGADEMEKLKSQVGDEGFAILAREYKGRPAVIILGGGEMGNLYGVYHYLEKILGVGFFPDGEYLPQLSSLPFDFAPVIEKPRFENRCYLIWNAHWGLKKYHSLMWGIEEWEKEIDWMTKKKFNMLRMDITPYNFESTIEQKILPGYKPTHGRRTTTDALGMPYGYNFPPEYRTQLLKGIVKYARQRGIKIIYSIRYGFVPDDFRKEHPEISYMDNGGCPVIHPSEDFAEEFTVKYLKELIKLVGTDHYYLGGSYGEKKGNNIEEMLDLRIQLTNRFKRALLRADPEAIHVTDTWTFLCEATNGLQKM